MYWLLQVLALLLGIFYVPLGASLLLLDGWFHLNADQAELERDSPDWVVARRFGAQGFSEGVHKAIGAALVISTVGVIHVLYQAYRGERQSPRQAKAVSLYRRYLMPISLVIIAVAIVLKHLYSQEAGVAFF